VKFPELDIEKVARDFGLDLTLIDSALTLNPEERLRQHQTALSLLEALQEARSYVSHGESKPTS
jgi:hypothetical protein